MGSRELERLKGVEPEASEWKILPKVRHVKFIKGDDSH